MKDLIKKRLPNNTLLHIVCLVVLILTIYVNTLSAPFQWDEDEYIVNNPIIKDLHYFVSPPDAQGFKYYNFLILRYIGYLTFALNYKIHGLSVTGYHMINIAIHMTNAILVYFLVLLTFRTPFLKTSVLKRHARSVAFFSALLFASHPLQTEAVTYVFQRFASLVALFYLVSLTAYIKSRLTKDRQGRLFFYCIAFFSAVLAMKTKENAFTLPLVITMYEFFFFSDTLKRRVIHLVPMLLTLSIIPLTLMSLTGTAGGRQPLPGSYGAGMFSRGEYLFTQFRVIVTYLRLLFFPVNQNLNYNYPVSHSFFDPQVVLSFLVLAALFGLGVYLVVRSQSNPHLRLMGFGILWFFITLSVESSIVPLDRLIDEYRVYLPSVGVSIAVVTGVFLIKEKMRSSKTGRSILVMLVLVTGVLSVATHLRNAMWEDGIKLWEDTVKKSPVTAKAHYNLAIAYQDRNIPDKAIEQYLIVIKLNPNNVKAHYNLAVAYRNLNMPDKAIEQYLTAVRLQPYNEKTHYNLGLIYCEQGRDIECTYEINTAYAINHYSRGVAYTEHGSFEKAVEEFQTAIKLKPDLAEAHSNLGFIYENLNMPDKAIEQYLIAIKLKPDFAEAHFNLGTIYYKMGQIEKAQRELAVGLKIKPDDQKAQQLLKVVSR